MGHEEHRLYNYIGGGRPFFDEILAKIRDSDKQVSGSAGKSGSKQQDPVTISEIISVFASNYSWDLQRILDLTLDQVKRLWLALDLSSLDDRMFTVAIHHGSKSKAYKQMERSQKKLRGKMRGSSQKIIPAPTAEKSMTAMAMSGHRVVIEQKGKAEDITNKNLFIRKR